MMTWIYRIAAVLVVFMMVGCGTKDPDKTDNKEMSKKEVTKKEKTEKGDKGKGRKKKGRKGDSDPDADTVPVQVVLPERGDISSFLLFSSNIDTEKAADVYPMTSGIIRKIVADIGDDVKKDAVLAELDDREASINERKSKSRHAQLKAEFGRKKELFEKKLISHETFEKAKFDMDQAELDWKQNKLLLSYTKITSPISGVVSKRLIKIGNKITTAQHAFSVIYTKEKIAVVNIPEQEKGQVFKNQKVLINTKKTELAGSIKSISPSIDPESGTFKVTVIVQDPKGEMSVGQFVNIRIIKKVHQNVILLTKDALLYEGGNVSLFTVDTKGVAHKKLVKTGFDNGIKVEIIAGIEMGDKVVTAGKSSLKDKAKVKIIESIL